MEALCIPINIGMQRDLNSSIYYPRAEVLCILSGFLGFQSFNSPHWIHRSKLKDLDLLLGCSTKSQSVKTQESNTANDTNKGESPSENNGPIRMIGFTRVWSQPTEDGKVTFCAETRLESQLLIPRMLVRLLPVTLDRIEEQRRAALQTLLKRMLKRMLNRQWSDFTKLVSNGFHVLLIL